MKKRNICVVVTARPSYSRIRSVLLEIERHADLELQLVVSGTAILDKYGKTDDFIEKDGFTITERVYNVLEGGNPTAMAKTTGMAILELSTVFLNLKPDAVITIADRYETIATSIASSYLNIPLVHIQGGEVTGNIDEKVRHANTKLADIHFAASSQAMERILKMGEDAEYVFNTGCPSIDIAMELTKSSYLNFDPFMKYSGVGKTFDYENGYIVVMQHPETTEYRNSREQIEETLHAVKEIHKPTFWFWPNSDAGTDGTSKGIRSFREAHRSMKVHFFKNMGSVDFLNLIKNAKCMVGNSSAGIRESAFLGVPVVNIGKRQESRDRAENVMDVWYDRTEIAKAINEQISHGPYNPSNLYGDGQSGRRIAEILATVELRSHKTLTY
ncbi:UDP-N-acetylglucosamine 2-epimerase [Roseivirga sp. E12]|uniref:UDP-N-acetylglucosamine 2-epimerase n=1 Tax=Roseivirga sp. E12 TaxID=2819237 RepID=UPI001ABD1280|nr:UDP-N-acetylglucosamine 2-epimerase (hydrolyzing) [Roseivirga sp. E12]